LAAKLRELLRAHDGGDSPLDISPASLARASLDEFVPGARLGPWVLDRLVAEGGMGQVWQGSRGDGEFEQQVAIKFPIIARSGPMYLRFESERQVLARLNHAHIARLLDGGSSASGCPYLVMEWIDGASITAYCRERNLGVRDRLQVFVPVCRAVDHAHRNLILHRDIKPGNILVTAGGQAKLLDFGIAKPLSGVDANVDQTRTALAFTPDYAAPEQIRGEAVGTPADVHALGAVLYELLTDRRAFERRDKTLAHIVEEATRNTAVAPSQRVVADRRRRRELHGDLDQIVLKALHRDPEQRYATASALADDIENWLQGRPVTARPDTAGYRLRKFVGRHPQGVVAGGAALLGLMVLSVFLALQTHRLGVALQKAQAQTQRARSVSGFLSDLFNQANPRMRDSKPPDLSTLLKQGVQQIDGAGLAPDISGSLKQTMGRALVDIGELERGRRTLLEALKQLPANEIDQRLRVLTSLAQEENLADRTDQALQYQRRALALAQRSGDGLKIRAAKAGLASILSNAGKREQARALLVEALDGLNDRGDKHERVQLAEARGKMASLYWSDGDYKKAQAQYEQVYKTIRAIYGDHHVRTADALYALGVIHLAQGNYARAETYLQRALALMQSLYEPVHPLTARTLNALGATLYQSGHSDAARKQYQAALAMEEKLFGTDSPRLIRVLGNLALVEHDLGRFDDAQQLYQRAIALDTAEHLKGSERQIAPLIDLALLNLDRDRPKAALPLLDRAAAIRKQRLPQQHPSSAFIAHVRGMTLLALGRAHAAVEQLQAARKQRAKLGDGRHPHLADTLIWLARA
ncbi:MAG: serine/threonine-protein kinase, partial [Rudaea sp.]